MYEPDIRIFSDPKQITQAAATHFANAVSHAVKLRGYALATLSGGNSPTGLFQRLAEPPYNTSIPWANIHFFWCDERCVPPEDPQSNYALANQLLLSQVAVNEQFIHRVRGELAPRAAVQDYTHQLLNFADQGLTWPRFDWMLLGLGADGHTASLFPGQYNQWEATRPVLAVIAEYEGRPAQRVTLTPSVFNSARSIVFIVTGTEKAHVLAQTLNGALPPLDLPARRILPDEGTVTWMVDQAAASEFLSKKP